MNHATLNLKILQISALLIKTKYVKISKSDQRVGWLDYVGAPGLNVKAWSGHEVGSRVTEALCIQLRDLQLGVGLFSQIGVL